MTKNAKFSVFYIVFAFFYLNYSILQLFPLTESYQFAVVFFFLLGDCFLLYILRETLIGNLEVYKNHNRRKYVKNRFTKILYVINQIIPLILLLSLPMDLLDRFLYYPLMIIVALCLIGLGDYWHWKRAKAEN